MIKAPFVAVASLLLTTAGAFAVDRVVLDTVSSRGVTVLRVTTASATYHLHPASGAMTSLLDRDTIDWLDLDSADGGDLGIPLMGDCCRLEDTATNGNSPFVLTVIKDEDLEASVTLEKASGTQKLHWDFRPSSATLTVLAWPGSYHLGYRGRQWEGIDTASQYYLLSDGTRRPVSTALKQDVSTQEWVALGNQSTRRTLVLIHHRDDALEDEVQAHADSSVSVLFGKSEQTGLLSGPAEQMSIAFAEDSVRAVIQTLVNFIVNNYTISVQSEDGLPRAQSGLEPAWLRQWRLDGRSRIHEPGSAFTLD